MSRTIPENPEPGKRYAEERLPSLWAVYDPDPTDGYRWVIANSLSESDARALVEGPDRERLLAEAVELVLWYQLRAIYCGWCGAARKHGCIPDCRLAAFLAKFPEVKS
jgi:hypothetical protein